MASGLLKNGVDLDTLFAARTSTAIANTGISVGGVDIANRYEKLSSGSAIAAVGFKVGGADLNTLFAGFGTVSSYSGSIEQYAAGTYTFTFTSNAIVTLAFLNGGGGGAAYYEDWGYAGGNSTLTLAGVLKATANGGQGSTHNMLPGANGTAANNSMLSGTATTGGAANGGISTDGYPPGGGGGSVTNGSVIAMSGNVLTAVVGGPGDGGDPGGSGSVKVTWLNSVSLVIPTSGSGQPWVVTDSGGTRYSSNVAGTTQIVTGRATSVNCWNMDSGDWNEWWDNFTIRDGSTTGTIVATSPSMPANGGNGGAPNTITFTPVAGHTYYVVSTGYQNASWS